MMRAGLKAGELQLAQPFADRASRHGDRKAPGDFRTQIQAGVRGPWAHLGRWSQRKWLIFRDIHAAGVRENLKFLDTRIDHFSVDRKRFSRYPLDMYLRITQRQNRDGSTVAYYALAENTWNATAKRAEARVVHNFGRADQLDRAALQRLVSSINRVLEEGEAVTTGTPELPRSRSSTWSNLAWCWPLAGCGRISASARRSGAVSPTAG